MEYGFINALKFKQLQLLPITHIKFANSNMSYGYSENTGKFFLLLGVDGFGFNSKSIDIIANADSYDKIRIEFFKRQ